MKTKKTIWQFKVEQTFGEKKDKNIHVYVENKIGTDNLGLTIDKALQGWMNETFTPDKKKLNCTSVKLLEATKICSIGEQSKTVIQ